MNPGLLVLLAASIWPAPVDQVRVMRRDDVRLAIIDAVDIVTRVEGDARCRVESGPLGESVRAALQRSGTRATISAQGPSWYYTVRVRVVSARSGETCASSLLTELVAEVEAVPVADYYAEPGTWGSWLVGESHLITESDVVLGAPEAHLSDVAAAAARRAAEIGQRVAKARAK